MDATARVPSDDERLHERVKEGAGDASASVAGFLEALLRALPAVVLRFDPELRIRFVSRLLPGIGEADILGAPALSFIPAEDHERALAVIGEALRTGRPGAYETLGPGPDGEPRPYQVFVAPVPERDGKTGGCFVAMDTSHLAQRERAFAQSEQKLRIALESTRLGLWSWELATEEIVWDDRMHQMMGRAVALPLSGYIEEAVHPDDRATIRESSARAITTGKFEASTHRVLLPDGQVRWMLTLGEIERDASGRPVRITGGNLDITEQRALEEQLRRAHKMEAVGQLTAGVAHNFNNMLMAILPCLELLREVVPESHGQLLADATGAAERAADMVRKLMTFAGRKWRRESGPCDAGAIAEYITGMCERTFDRRIALSCRVTAAARHVNMDPGDLEQLLLNLLLNARDAVLEPGRPSPSIELLVEGQTADAKLPGVSPVLVARVRDNGAGMSDLAKQHLFEPFFTSKEVGSGTGLGLATSYALARDAGGLIEVDSTLGVGTTVSVLLPATAQRTTAKAPEPAPANTVALPSVLVVDDEPQVRRALAQALQTSGYAVRTARDGNDALAQLADAPADVVLLDRSMPGLSGVALLPALRAAAPRAAIAYLTGQEVPPDERDVVDAVIQKPLAIAELDQAVSALLRQGS